MTEINCFCSVLSGISRREVARIVATCNLDSRDTVIAVSTATRINAIAASAANDRTSIFHPLSFVSFGNLSFSKYTPYQTKKLATTSIGASRIRLDSLSREARAIRHYTKASDLGLPPGDRVSCMICLASSYRNKKRYEEALSAIEHAAAEFPGNEVGSFFRR
jgi:hypothetical protein